MIKKEVYAIAKTLGDGLPALTAGGGGGGGDEEAEALSLRRQEERLRREKMEEELMGDTRGSGGGSMRQSNVKERNLSQMVAVLHMRLSSLEATTKLRMELCADDVNKNSKRESKLFFKSADDISEFVGGDPKGANKSSAVGGGGGGGGGHRETNLVSAEGVFIDPVHLVLRTKAPTETAKRLESSLDEVFGVSNPRDSKSKKKSGGGQGTGQKSKKTEQQKYEAKKQTRLRLEKELVGNMESFVTRSILDPEVTFSAPLSSRDALTWPISVKWCSADPQSRSPENSDGEMDPDLLLRYSVERISLPSGEAVFKWLLRQPSVQQYYVSLFWLIKVKFFQNEVDGHNESYLLRAMSGKYAAMMDLLSARTHAEHEKDFVYRFLPYLLCNSVYFGFFFLCPGSRHLYTKGFRKTILMQIVQMMHGVQLCPISVKVSWAKLFPEDAHEDEEGGEDGGESIPVQIALKKTNADASAMMNHNTNKSHQGLLSSSEVEGGSPINNATTTANNFSATSNGIGGGGGAAAAAAALTRTQSAPNPGFTSASNLNNNNNNNSSSSKTLMTTTTAAAAAALAEAAMDDPLSRTYLQAPLERPSRNFVAMRQNVVTMDAQNLSPLMQQFLNAPGMLTKRKQPLFRTVPVSWCPAGGSDTYHRRQVPKELHDSISAQVAKSESEFVHLGLKFSKRKLAAVKLIDKNCAILLSSGQTRISQCALDLMKNQKKSKERGHGSNSNEAAALDEEELEMSQAQHLTFFDDGNLDAVLEEF